VLGRSNIVGRPMASLLLRKAAGGNATVTVAHSRTPDLGAVAREADILIVAIGRPGLVTADMVKPGAVVIDVGVNRVDAPEREKGYRLVGDVAYDEVAEVAGDMTVDGGRHIFRTTRSSDLIAALVTAAARHTVAVDDWEVTAPSLEDAFIQMVADTDGTTDE